MIASDGEHGGRTKLSWGFTAAAPNQNPDLPLNLEVLQSVSGPAGNRTMRYERATLAGGEVTPFAQVAVAGDRGAVEVYAFIVAPWARGAQHVGARYREDGSLEHVTVQEHGLSGSGYQSTSSS